MRRQLVLFLALVPFAGCGSDLPLSPGPDPDLLIANDFAVSLGGERLAGPPADAWTKIEPLAAKLKERRDKWTAEQPHYSTFPGELTLDVGPTLTCRAAMSVFMTAARSDFHRLTVKQGSTSLKLPYFHVPEDEPDRCLMPQREMVAVFLANGDVSLHIQRCMGAFDVVPAASLASMVKEFCGNNEDCFDGLRIACDPGIPMATVLGAVAELKRFQPKMALGLARGCKGDGDSPYYPAPPEPPATAEPAPAPAPSVAPGKKAVAPKVQVDTITTKGGLTPQEVEEALRPKLADIRACYEAGLAERPDLKGRAVVKLIVGKGGAVMQIVHGDSEVDQGGMTVSCIVRQFYKGVSFPAKGAMTWVTYPVLLSPR